MERLRIWTRQAKSKPPYTYTRLKQNQSRMRRAKIVRGTIEDLLKSGLKTEETTAPQSTLQGLNYGTAKLINNQEEKFPDGNGRCK